MKFLKHFILVAFLGSHQLPLANPTQDREGEDACLFLEVKKYIVSTKREEINTLKELMASKEEALEGILSNEDFQKEKEEMAKKRESQDKIRLGAGSFTVGNIAAAIPFFPKKGPNGNYIIAHNSKKLKLSTKAIYAGLFVNIFALAKASAKSVEIEEQWVEIQEPVRIVEEEIEKVKESLELAQRELEEMEINLESQRQEWQDRCESESQDQMAE